MEITEVRIRLRDDEKLRAFVSITFDSCFVVQGMKIINGGKGLFVAMPSRRRPDGSFQDICHPLDGKTREWIERVILEKYWETVEESHADEASEADGATSSGQERFSSTPTS